VKKLTAILLSTVIILLTAYDVNAASASIPQCEYNAIGNVQNNGIVTFYDDRIYYFDFGSRRRLNSGLTSANPDGSDKVKISDDYFWVSGINVVDGWIYYSCFRGHIYKIEINGENKTTLSTWNINAVGYPHNLQIQDDWIYFQLERSEVIGDVGNMGGIGGTFWTFWKMKTDGTELTKIYDGEDGFNMIVYGDWIYYLLRAPDTAFWGDRDYTLWRMKLDGSGQEKLIDYNVEWFTIDRGYLYFSNQFSTLIDNGTFSLNLNDMSVNKISENIWSSLNAHNGMIFYTASSSGRRLGDSIYRYDIETGESTFLNTNGFRLNIAGDRLFYQYTIRTTLLSGITQGSAGIASVRFDGTDILTHETYSLSSSVEVFTTQDALTVLRAVAGVAALTNEQLCRLRIFGLPTTTDALQILRIVAGLT
jgi:outer membrane protein assembly factor BamB